MSLTSPRSTFLFLLVAAFSAAFVSADKYCHNYDRDCDVEINSGKAIHALWSQHRNGKGDRIWTFSSKNVPFGTSSTTKTGYVNNWDGRGHWRVLTNTLSAGIRRTVIGKKTVV